MRVLLVEDEERLATTIARGLRREGMAVDVVLDGAAALDKAAVNSYDVVVLDRNLPMVHGDDVCRELVARECLARILMLTAAGSIKDRVTGLDLGADDYLPKPFALTELVARIRALGRRAVPAVPPVLARGRPDARPGQARGPAGRARPEPHQEGVRRAGGAAFRRGAGGERRGAPREGLGRERRSLHQRGAGHHHDVATQARRSAARSRRSPAWATRYECRAPHEAATACRGADQARPHHPAQAHPLVRVPLPPGRRRPHRHQLLHGPQQPDHRPREGPGGGGRAVRHPPGGARVPPHPRASTPARCSGTSPSTASLCPSSSTRRSTS